MDADLADPKDKLVLIVDDDDAMLELVEALVSYEGFRIEKAVNGTQAIEKTRASKPDLIVLDLMLPGKEGYEVVRELQAEGFGDIPVVVVTGRTIDRKLKDMLKFEPNVRDLVTKPLPQLFPKTLHAHLNTRPPAAT
jgi:two-component system OmpR family response regulator